MEVKYENLNMKIRKRKSNMKMITSVKIHHLLLPPLVAGKSVAVSTKNISINSSH